MTKTPHDDRADDRADERAVGGLIVLENQGPWGNRGGSGGGNNGGGNNGDNNNPWGQRPRGNGNGGNNPPDLDDMLRQAQDKFKNRFGGGGYNGDRGNPQMETGKALGILAVVVLLLWAATGFYTVQPQEDAVILTFGKVTDMKSDAGLGYHLPWPVQEAITVPVARTNQLNIGVNSDGSDNPTESSMLTGDENIVDIHFSVFWNISDARQYLFDIQQPVEATVQKVAESAMREIIGHTTILSALTEGRADIESKTKELMQKMLDDYHAGVTVNSVQLLSVDPPQPVVDAFNDVQRARTEQERMKNEAEAYRNNVVKVAEGDASAITKEAEGYKESVVKRAEGDADRFVSVYKAYADAKDVTQKRMYLETMQEILKKSRKVMLGGDKAVLPYLQLDTKGAVAVPPAPAQN